jgi:sugar phosphate isomerase/epimerase
LRIGICTSVETFDTPPEGVEYLEPSVADLLCPDEDEQTAAAQRARAPIATEAANCLLPGSCKTTGPDSDPDAVAERMATILSRAAAAGVEVLVFGSGGSRRIPDGFDADRGRTQLLEHLTRWAPLAADAGVTVCVEPLNQGDCNILTSLDEAAALVRQVDHPQIRLLADTYHMGLDDDPPEAIVRHGDLLAHVHVAEVRDRAAPGTGGQDFGPYFRALAAAGYDGRVSIEARWSDIHAQLPGALAALREQIETA